MTDPALTQKLSAQIDARRQQLAVEIREKMAAARDVVGTGAVDQLIERGDAALADSLAELDLAEVRRDLDELRALDAASERIATGAYGVCPDCGADIEPARLAAYPAALRCVTCQERHEAAIGLHRPSL